MPDLDLLRGLADEIVPPPFEALRETARRRTRRATAVTVVAAAAAVALVVGVTFLAVTDDDRKPRPIGPPEVVDTTHPLTYAEGTAVHYGDKTVTVPDVVAELDVTDAGVVVRTEDGRIWLTDGAGVDQVGTLGSPGKAYDVEDHPYATSWGFVVSGNSGTSAAWLEFPKPGEPEVVVYDTRAHKESARQALEVTPGSYALLSSVTERYGYWFTSPETTGDDISLPQARIELATGTQERVTRKSFEADTPGVGTAAHDDGQPRPGQGTGRVPGPRRHGVAVRHRRRTGGAARCPAAGRSRRRDAQAVLLRSPRRLSGHGAELAHPVARRRHRRDHGEPSRQGRPARVPRLHTSLLRSPSACPTPRSCPRSADGPRATFSPPLGVLPGGGSDHERRPARAATGGGPSMNRRRLAALLAVTAVLASTGCLGSESVDPPRPAPSVADPAPADEPARVVTLGFAGDVHFQLHLAALLDHPRGALGPIARALRRADVTMVNLESAITNGGARDPKELEVPSDRYWFRAPPAALDLLERAGVDVVTMANNHGADYGADGLADTLRAARRSPIPVVGVGRDRGAALTPYRVTVKDTDIAFFAADASPREGSSSVWEAGVNNPGIAAARGARTLRALLAALRATARDEVAVVYLHWGAPDTACPSRAQRQLARALADAGADVVVGTHAHVLQGAGWLGDTYVAYGLGNFLWYHDHRPTAESSSCGWRTGAWCPTTGCPPRSRCSDGRSRCTATHVPLRSPDGVRCGAARVWPPDPSRHPRPTRSPRPASRLATCRRTPRPCTGSVRRCGPACAPPTARGARCRGRTSGTCGCPTSASTGATTSARWSSPHVTRGMWQESSPGCTTPAGRSGRCGWPATSTGTTTGRWRPTTPRRTTVAGWPGATAGRTTPSARRSTSTRSRTPIW